jgi:hypothetical protein
LIITGNARLGQWFDMRDLRQVVEHIHDAGDPEHIKVFANADAEKWFEENDPEAVAFEYEVIDPE